MLSNSAKKLSTIRTRNKIISFNFFSGSVKASLLQRRNPKLLSRDMHFNANSRAL